VRMLELKSKNSSDHGMVPVAVYVVSILSLGHFNFFSITLELVTDDNLYVFIIT
jgi:hypothetical protein